MGNQDFHELSTSQRTETIQQLQQRLGEVDTCLICGGDTAQYGEVGVHALISGVHAFTRTEGLDEVENAVQICTGCRNDLLTKWRGEEVLNCPDCGADIEYVNHIEPEAEGVDIEPEAEGVAQGLIKCVDNCGYEAQEEWVIRETNRVE